VSVPEPPLPRGQFPVTERWVFFNHAGVAPIPVVAADAVRRWADETLIDGGLASTPQEAEAEEVRRRGARLMGVPPADVAFVKNTTEGLGFVANGIDWAPGDRVVVPNAEFPSTIYPWLALEERGVTVDRVPPVDGTGALPVEAFAERIAGTGHRPPRLVALSWVQFARGWRSDVVEIARLCRDAGSLLCVDVIQGLGVVPCQLAAWGVDFAMADAHKWMLGPSGCGLLYVRGSRRNLLRPLEPGWNSVIHREEWDNLEVVWDDSARRFEGGTLNLPGILGLGASIGMLLDTGVDRIWAHVDDLCGRVAEGVADLGAEVLSDRGEGRSAIVSFRFPGVRNRWLWEQLEGRGFAVVPRGRAMRVSPHGYNSVEEVERFVATVAELVMAAP
jgi:cysteine desulfurase/selenocysteine lyase